MLQAKNPKMSKGAFAQLLGMFALGTINIVGWASSYLSSYLHVSSSNMIGVVLYITCLMVNVSLVVAIVLQDGMLVSH